MRSLCPFHLWNPEGKRSSGVGSQVTERGPGGRGFGGLHGGTRRVVVPVTRRLALEDTRHEETEPVLGRAQGEGLDLGRGDRK